MRTQSRALAVSLLLVTAGGGCADGTEPEERGIHGTYALETINDARLPFLLLNNEIEKIEVTSGSIELRLDGTFRDEMSYRVTPVGGTPGPEGELFTGTFLHDLTTLYMTPEPDQGGPYELTILPNGTLQIFVSRYRLIYSR